MNARFTAVALATVLATGAAATTADADVIFSGISYTSSSLTFTVSGDITGEAAPDPFVRDEFMIRYLGDLWSGGPGAYSTFTDSPFVSNPLNIAWTGFSGQPVTYSDFEWEFTTAPFGSGTGQSVTVFLGGNYLNAVALNPVVEFEWGANDYGYTVLETVRLSPDVPEPTILLLMGGGLAAGLILRHRRRLGRAGAR